MKRLVYTAVFGGYDRVYPPICIDENTDYIVFTDQKDFDVAGWNACFVDSSIFPSFKVANLYYRALAHRVLPHYDMSLYVDGNVRILGSTYELFDELATVGADLAQFRHPHRSTVAEEIEAAIKAKKITEPETARHELLSYRMDGFDDDIPLAETGILLKNHRSNRLDNAMNVWWNCFEKYQQRDQFSLSYAVWKTGLRVHYFPGTFRDRNPVFALYPHVGTANVNPYYSHVSARSHDSRRYKVILAAWHAQWKLKRFLRN